MGDPLLLTGVNATSSLGNQGLVAQVCWYWKLFGFLFCVRDLASIFTFDLFFSIVHSFAIINLPSQPD